MAKIDKLEAEIRSIKERNRRVEADKAWERSWSRRALLMLFTYLAIGIYLNVINIPNAWLTAVVPSVGFMLSTLTLPYFKSLWVSRVYKG